MKLLNLVPNIVSRSTLPYIATRSTGSHPRLSYHHWWLTTPHLHPLRHTRHHLGSNIYTQPYMYRKTSTWYNVPLTSCLERDKTQPLNKPTLQSSAKSTPFGTSQTTSNGQFHSLLCAKRCFLGISCWVFIRMPWGFVFWIPLWNTNPMMYNMAHQCQKPVWEKFNSLEQLLFWGYRCVLA